MAYCPANCVGSQGNADKPSSTLKERTREPGLILGQMSALEKLGALWSAGTSLAEPWVRHLFEVRL